MKRPDRPDLEQYYQAAETWAEDRTVELAASRRTAWIVAGVAAAIALLEAIALVLLTPLKTVVPYTLLVDRQTGHVEALKPLERETVSPDTALVRSFLVQYVIGREGFDIDSLNDTYRKVALWSAEEARSRYLAEMQASNPLSPLATLPRRALVEVQVRSVSSFSADTSMVRFSTTRRDPGGQPQAPQYWAAVVKYRFSGAAMSAEDRMINPLGFQVLRYRRDAETMPETAVMPAAQPAFGGAAAPYQAPAPPRAIPNVRQPGGASGPGL
jgi:type IV secretion system protein VirB8